MEDRWPVPEPGRARRVESDSASEILALAQRLQAEASGLLSEEQVIEMGRELGLEPRHVREAIRLRQPIARVSPPAAAPVATTPGATPFLSSAEGSEPLAAVGRAFVVIFGLAMAPAAMDTLSRGNAAFVPFLALFASVIVGWIARYPRLAGVAGVLTVPMALLITFFHMAAMPWDMPGPDFSGVFFTLLAFGPLCWATARGAAGVRNWAERQGTPREWPAADR